MPSKPKSKLKSPTPEVLSQSQELLEQLQFPAQVTVEFDELSSYYQVQIDTETPGLLIGYRGETLAAFQLILSLIINHGVSAASQDKAAMEDKQKDWKKILVNVGDYRQRREETLTHLAQNAAQRVSFSGEPYFFDRLSPSERRVIHMALQDHPEITTASEGEGRYRRLVVVKK